jgi:hypothetical protein
MDTDLEKTLRDSLRNRSLGVTEDRLRRPTRRPARVSTPHAGSGRLWPALAGVAVIAVVVAVAVFVRSGGNAVFRQPAAGPQNSTSRLGQTEPAKSPVSMYVRNCTHGAKCAPGLAPPSTIHLTVHGKQFALLPGQSTTLELKLQHPIVISLSIDSPTGAAVQDIWLTVNSYPSGFGPVRPTGRAEILTHHAGLLSPGQAVTASWTPVALFGTTKLDLTLEFGIGDFGIGTALAHLNIKS